MPHACVSRQPKPDRNREICLRTSQCEGINLESFCILRSGLRTKAMQRHILRRLPRTFATTAKASSASLLSRQFSAQVQVKQTNLFINNKFTPSASGATFDTFNPATEEKIASISEATTADVDAAVDAARAAFNGPWRTMDAAERGRLLFRLADLIEQNGDELAQLEALDAGKPSFLTRVLDVQASLNVLRYYAGWADKIHGSTVPISGPYLCYTKQEPVGVCGQIIPWNFPMIMMAWKLGPALTTGNTVVLKPAEQTSLTALRIAELIVEAGFPEGVVNIVTGGGATVGAHLAQHPKVDKIAFTGSTETGMNIMRSSHVDNLKRVTLELGGKSANIILDDADIDKAVQQSQMGLFLNAGQICISGSRVYVQEGIYDEFVRRSAEAAQSMKIGDPFDLTTQHGPQIDGNQFNKIMGYIESGKKDGARLVCGGKRWGDKGFFIEPTIFADVNEDMAIAREEIFGPVMSIIKFKTIDEVIERANNSEFGLGAGVVTSNLDNAIKISNGVRAGTVYVNCYSVIEPNTPFGGFKNSGLGREQGELGLRNYLENKTVIIKRPDDSMP
ncbi:Aldehyde dehydrogenase [Phytophthora rubi]|uniref:Aldehyde dehydrogenase n=2 Tax=Phytophthora rubi TaxID=129364 RepID=A0A6A3JAA1_9STRA|nr:Aldehyde dehydrogenase [Phytophthora rubi]